jgi:hypothetical protein
MRISFSSIGLAAVLSAPLAAQVTPARPQAGQKPGTTRMEHMEGPWKEMNAFHAVLSSTFHPARDKKDLKPLRQRADQLAAAARAWSASTAPAPCASPDVRTTVGAIATDALAIGNLVLAEADDAALLKAISTLHDKFEVVEKACGAHAGMKHQ